MSSFFIWLSGANRDVLARCPGERVKLATLGGTVLTTAVLAAVAATFTTHSFLHVELTTAIPIGLFWGLAIMNLDRWLLATLRRQSSTWLTLASCLPRLLLALVVGLVISEPLVLQVFEGEVSAQASKDKQANLAKAKAALKGERGEVGRLTAQQARLQGELTDGNDARLLNANTQWRGLTQAVHGLQQRLAHAQNGSICELEGKCGSEKAGKGPVYQERKALARTLQAELNTKQGELDRLTDQLVQEGKRQRATADGFARTKLNTVRADLTRAKAQLKADEDEARRRNLAAIGFLDRVEALSRLTHEHGSMRWIRWVLQLFILALDSLPVLSKMVLMLGKPTLYDQMLEDTEEAALTDARLDRSRREKAHRIESRTIVDEARTRRRFEHDALEEILEEIVGVQKEVASAYVTRWKVDALASIPPPPPAAAASTIGHGVATGAGGAAAAPATLTVDGKVVTGPRIMPRG